MAINPEKQPNEALQAGIHFCNKNDYAKAQQVGLALIKFNHYEHGYTLIEALITAPLDAAKAKVIMALAKPLAAKKQEALIKKVGSKIVAITGNKDHPALRALKKLILSNQTKPPQVNEKITKTVDINALARKDQETDNGASLEPQTDLVSNEEKQSFKEFYLSFLTEEVKSLVVTCEKGSTLGNYIAHITREQIDLRKIDDDYEKKYLYRFDTQTLKIEGQDKDDSFLRQFYTMMQKVSSDVKNNHAKLLQESF